MWLIDAVTDWFWVGLVERKSRGKPWWVWLFWVLLPLIVLAGMGAALWIVFG